MDNESVQPLINAVRLREIFMDSLADDPEQLAAAVIVDGIRVKVGFLPLRLAHYENEIFEMLLNLPAQFRASVGGGWTFLNMGEDRNNVQWTGLQQSMEQLMMLGIAIERVRYLLPRSMWSAFPGQVPYIVVYDNEKAQTMLDEDTQGDEPVDEKS